MAVLTYIISFFASIWRWIGGTWLPIWKGILDHEMGWLMITVGSVVLFVLGIALQASGWKEHNIFDDMDQLFELPEWFAWPVIVMRVFYPVMVIYFSMMLTKGGGFFTALAEIPYTFGNYAEWMWVDQVMGAVVVVEFLLLSLVCVLRLKPKRLIRFWVHTIDFILIGYLIGSFFLLMQELTEGIFLLAFLVSLCESFVDVAIPVIVYITTLAPVYCFVLGLLSPILRLFGCFDVDITMESGKSYSGNTLLMLLDVFLP